MYCNEYNCLELAMHNDKYCQEHMKRPAEPISSGASTGEQPPRLLHKPNDPLPDGCYCKSGQCMAPVIMGRQMPCRDPEKAQGKQRCCDNGYFGEEHECQKSNPEAARPSEPSAQPGPEEKPK